MDRAGDGLDTGGGPSPPEPMLAAGGEGEGNPSSVTVAPVISIHAAFRDGSRSCQLMLDTHELPQWSEVEARLLSELNVDGSNSVITYGINPDILGKRRLHAFQCLTLSMDVDWKAAVVTATSLPEPALYFLVEEINPPSDLIMSARAVLKKERKPVIGGSRGGTKTTTGGKLKRRLSSLWDLLDHDSVDVRQLWQQLPSMNLLPFSALLRWHMASVKSRKAVLNTLANTVPLQEFEWPEFLDKSRRLVCEPELRLRVFYGGVSPELRPIIWRHLLYVFPPKMDWKDRYAHIQEKREEYIQLRRAWQSSSALLPPSMKALLKSIRQDVVRTDCGRTTFAGTSPAVERLYNMLVTFSLTHLNISYSQGMNEIAAVFLEVYKGDEADAYISFNSYMELVPSLFAPDGFLLKISHFRALLHRFDSTLHDYLRGHGCQDLSFCFSWILLNMKRDFDHSDLLLLWDVMWSTLSPPDWYVAMLHEETGPQLQLQLQGDKPTPVAQATPPEKCPPQRSVVGIEHSAREVAGDWLRASQVEDGQLPDSPALTPTDDAHFESPTQVSLQKQYGNLLVLFVGVVLVIDKRKRLLAGDPTEEVLNLLFSQNRGLYDVHHLLQRARGLMEEFVSTNDEVPMA